MYHTIRSFYRAGILYLIFIIGFLLVSAMPSSAGCDLEETMAQWVVPNGSSNPPDSIDSGTGRGLPTTKAGNVITALAYGGTPALTKISTTIGYGVDAHSWEIWGTGGNGNEIRFEIDTTNFSEVHISFYRMRQTSNSPTALQIRYDNGSGLIQNGADININDDMNWHLHNKTSNPNELDFTGKTNTNGTTIFRIRPIGASDNDQPMNFDVITFTGRTCYPAPTLSKTFTPSVVSVYADEGDLSLLEFTISNTVNNPNHSQDLTNVTFYDALPAGVQIYNAGSYTASTNCPSATLTAPHEGSTIDFEFGTMDAGTTYWARVYVSGTTPGNKENQSSLIDSDESDPSTTYGFATLIVRAIPSEPTDVSASPDTICRGSSSSLSATVESGQTAQWYSGSCKTGTLIGTGSPLSVSPNDTTTYYVSAKDDFTEEESDCASTSVTVTVNALPDTPTGPTATPAAICSSIGSSTLSATVGLNETVDWFTDSCGGTAVLSNPVSPVTTTTYYARARDTITGCVSASCATVTVTVGSDPPTVSISPANPSVCSGSTITLTANTTSSLPITGYQWNIGGVPIGGATGSTYNTGTAGSYTVDVTNACGTTTSGAVTLVVNPLPATPTDPTATPSAINYGESADLTATVDPGETVDWHIGGCGGAIVGSGSPLTVSPASTTTYYARARNTATDCVSASCAAITVTVLSLDRLALDFDGTDDLVSVPDDMINHTLDLTARGTLEAWIYPTAFTPGAGIVFKGTSASCYGFGFGSESDTARNIRFMLGTGSGDISLTATDKTLSANKWYHVACVWDTTSSPYMEIYINGIQEAAYTAAIANAQTNNEALRFGVSAPGAPDNYFEGVIDEIRVWATDRDYSDIRTRMCMKLAGDEPGLAGYWRFDEKSTLLCADTSVHGNVGTISGAVRICSQAPIGDESDCDYTASFSASLASLNGDNLSAVKAGGTWDSGLGSCIHVYRVDGPPDYTIAPFGWKSFDHSPRYWGVFMAGGTNPEYEMVYHYDGYPDIGNENTLQMAYRNHNCEPWKDLGATLSTAAKTLTKEGLTGTEFILGADVDPRNTIVYNGSSQYVEVSDESSLGLDDEGTLEAWIYPESFIAGAGIVLKGDTTVASTNSVCYGFGLGNGAGTVFTGGTSSAHIDFVVGNTSGGVYRLTGSGTPTLAQDTWFHVACVWDTDPDLMAIYLNGVLYASSTATIDNAARSNTGPLRFGMDAVSNPDIYFDGRIDEVRIWNEARTQGEIQTYMCQKIDSVDPNLVGYWRFDEETTSPTSDDFGATPSNTATMYGFGTATGIITARACSEAPIGDDSAFDYGAASSATIYHPDGDYFLASSYGGTWADGTFSGLHVYRVDGPPVYPPHINGPLPYDPYKTPNGLTPPDNWSSIDYSRYWGVFLTDWATANQPTYDAVYHYGTVGNGNPNVPDAADPGDSSTPQIDLAKRDSYCDTTWAATNANWAFGTRQLELLGANSQDQAQNSPSKTNPEYILGGKNQPLAISLAFFTAAVVDGCIEILWETATEIDTMGFQLWRSTEKDGPYEQVSGGLIASKSEMETMGASYDYTDCDAETGGKTIYYYKLEEIDMDSTTDNDVYGPIGPVTDTITASQTRGDRSGNDNACFISVTVE